MSISVRLQNSSEFFRSLWHLTGAVLGKQHPLEDRVWVFQVGQ